MIYFIGAGPGAADLITVRGMRLLERADVIVYAGSLVSPALLGYAKKDCIVYDSAYMTLNEIISVMTDNDGEGRTVVRLHTGDPSIYGAVREQYDRLDAMEVKYEICPGVSSFCGAAAALRAELTLPEVSQTVILTRAEGRTPVPSGEELSLLAQHKATMVIFLSAGMGQKVQDRLLTHYPEDTPAAIVYRATWEDERVLRCTAGTIARTLAESGIDRHALICVGRALDGGTLSRLYAADFSTGYRK